MSRTVDAPNALHGRQRHRASCAARPDGRAGRRREARGLRPEPPIGALALVARTRERAGSQPLRPVRTARWLPDYSRAANDRAGRTRTECPRRRSFHEILCPSRVRRAVPRRSRVSDVVIVIRDDAVVVLQWHDFVGIAGDRPTLRFPVAVSMDCRTSSAIFPTVLPSRIRLGAPASSTCAMQTATGCSSTATCSAVRPSSGRIGASARTPARPFELKRLTREGPEILRKGASAVPVQRATRTLKDIWRRDQSRLAIVRRPAEQGA